ncbi:MAG: hypothetical protein AAF747_02770 [Planctomycetota bacterium]
MQTLDAKIAATRAELADLRQQRAAAVHDLERVLGLGDRCEFSTRLGTITAKPERRVSFPTKHSNESQRTAFIGVLRRSGLWAAFSMPAYSALKAAWFKADSLLTPAKADLRPLVSETVGLSVRCRAPRDAG